MTFFLAIKENFNNLVCLFISQTKIKTGYYYILKEL